MKLNFKDLPKAKLVDYHMSSEDEGWFNVNVEGFGIVKYFLTPTHGSIGSILSRGKMSAEEERRLGDGWITAEDEVRKKLKMALRLSQYDGSPNT